MGLVRQAGMAIDKEIRQQLIAKGKAQGYVTYDDVLALLPSAEQDIEALEDVMDELARAEVRVESDPPRATSRANGHDMPGDGTEPSDEPSDEELEVLGQGLADLMDDAGYQQALETDDVIGLYLKEAGSVRLLDYEEEISLAKRIEQGELAKAQLAEYGDQLPLDDRYDL